MRTRALSCDAPLVLLLLLCSCSEPAAPAPAPDQQSGCVTSSDCGPGESCEGGSCVGGGQGGGGVDECAASDDCRGPFDAVPNLYWDGDPGSEPTCTVPARSCPGTVACNVATVCSDAPDGATRPGAVRCETDEQCWSGRCLDLGADRPRVCLRACATDGDCASVVDDNPGVGRVGLSCLEVLVANVRISTCLPIDDDRPGQTLCRRDCDCGASDSCDSPPADGSHCTFVGEGNGNRAVPLCVVPDPLAEQQNPARYRCVGGPSCEGGACARPCESNLTDPEHLCVTTPSRCTRPCALDGDCPDRMVCREGSDSNRAGAWLIDGQDASDPGRAVLSCMLPQQGCYEESDCCPVSDGAGGCLHGWSFERRRCSVAFSPQAEQPRLLTVCKEIDGRLTPGDCCASHAECDSDLCVPGRDGTACAGGGVCSVPCDPDPEENPFDPALAARQLCSFLATPGNDYHVESSCLPYDYPLPGGGSVGLRVCR